MTARQNVAMGVLFVVGASIFAFGGWVVFCNGPSITDNDEVVGRSYNVAGDRIGIGIRLGDVEGYPDGLIRIMAPEGASDVFITPNDPTVERLWEKIGPYLDGKSGAEVANLLLRFVQSNISYASDADSGYRNYSQFPAETLLSKTGDCEDMAFLLCTLYEKAGLGSVIVRSGDHISVGVAVDLDEGYYITLPFSDKRYFIAEPTSYSPVGEYFLDDAYGFVVAPYLGVFLMVMGSFALAFLVWAVTRDRREEEQ